MTLQYYRAMGDPPADKVVEVVQSQMPSLWSSGTWKAFSRNSDQPDKIWPDELLAFIQENEALPPFSDLRLLKNGQTFFSKNQQLVFLCLGLCSLPYCYAAADGARVLYHSNRLKQAPAKRLEETASFVLDVCEPGAFEMGGKAFRSIIKVRLMHAIARYYLRRQPFWNAEWGLPVNQEDMAGTNLAFSLVVLRAIRKLGVDVVATESQSYLHLWRVIGALLGVESELQTANVREALKLEKAIARRHFKKSAEGVELTAVLRQYIESQITGNSAQFPVEGLMVHLLGTEVARLLGLNPLADQSLAARSFIGLAKWQQATGFGFLMKPNQIDRVNL